MNIFKLFAAVPFLQEIGANFDAAPATDGARDLGNGLERPVPVYRGVWE